MHMISLVSGFISSDLHALEVKHSLCRTFIRLPVHGAPNKLTSVEIFIMANQKYM